MSKKEKKPEPMPEPELGDLVRLLLWRYAFGKENKKYQKKYVASGTVIDIKTHNALRKFRVKHASTWGTTSGWYTYDDLLQPHERIS